jgi:hypothetical protein
MPVDDLELIAGKRGSKPVLRVGETRLELDQGAIYRLCKIGMRCRDLYTGPYPAEGPFVVFAKLGYSDLSNDQSTPHYTWGIATSTLELALVIKAAADDELARTDGFRFEVAPIPACPDEDFHLSSMGLCDTVAVAISDLRITLLGHQSDSVRGDEDYWLKSGFSKAEYATLDESNVLDDWSTEDDPDSDEIKAAFLKEFDLPDNLLPGLEDTDQDVVLYRKFCRWVDGEDVREPALESTP